MDSNQVDLENKPQEVNAQSGPRSVHGFKWFLAAISLYVAVFVYALDGTIAADIQSSIIEQFNDVGSLTWIGTGFPLGSLCFILPSAGFYAIFNFKPIFILSILIFEAASALCGAAPNMNALIVGRVIAGVGGTGIFMG
ncbi:Efflux pump DEP3 [Lachnellula cervina]|uniref:Efflux pump DEP3 n=1 Tax=Lachnellula cervina TaxID=1316786 RepID=A0A7D8UQF9_9HELO|nr:Efflux pump DEP3 [Lachnellula cervina]